MIINKKKSGIIKFKKKDSNQPQEQEIEGIPIVKQYKYLGIIIDQKMSMEPQLEFLKNKIEKGMKLVRILRWKRASL